MGFLKNIFKKKDEKINTYADFWNWFQANEKVFFDVVKNRTDIEKNFFNKLSPKLAELKDGFFFVTGMYDEHTAELILTADGFVENIVFTEELIAAAPQIKNWRFTSLKPSLNVEDVNIKMGDYEYNKDNLSFYANDTPDTPDEIDVTIVYVDYKEQDKNTITSGIYIFLDNLLGELNFATLIDNLIIKGKHEAEKELIPIEKLNDFIVWRQKEFVERYEGTKHNTENDNFSMLEATLQSGNPLIAVINTDLLKWDAKASHPWILEVQMKYDGSQNNGLPDKGTYKLMDDIEDDMLNSLNDFDGYLNIGRQTSEGVREVYFACKDFRKPSKVVYDLQKRFSGLIEMSYDIYKDKYWKSFDRFSGNQI